MLWRLVVNPFTNPVIITRDGPIDAIERLEVDARGNCGEGVIIAQAGVTPIRVRDAVQVQRWYASSSAWLNVYYGMCVGAPSAYSKDLGVYRFTGLKRRFYETYPAQVPPVLTFSGSKLVGEEVSMMASYAAAFARERIGLSVKFDDELFLDTDFSLGDRAYGTESFGQVLDALAETVGAFTAPAGGYGKHGRFYPDGSVVPAVGWGVDRDGFVFFYRYRPDVITQVLYESGEEEHFEWLDDNGEEIVARIRVVFAEAGPFTFRRAYGGSTNLPHSESHIPLYEDADQLDLTGFGVVNLPTGSPQKQIILEHPLDFMSTITREASSVSVLPDNYLNMFDGDDSTVTHFTTATSLRVVYNARAVILRVLFDQTTEDAELTVSARWNQEVTDTGPWRAATQNIRLDAERGPLGLTEAVIPILLPSDINFLSFDESPALRTHVAFSITAGVSVHSLQAFALGSASASAARRMLGAHLSLPNDVVGVATFLGGIPVQVADRITLHPASGGASLTVPVVRTEYSITREDGAVTRYHVGQPFESEMVSERILLERLAQSAVRKGRV